MYRILIAEPAGEHSFNHKKNRRSPQPLRPVLLRKRIERSGICGSAAYAAAVSGARLKNKYHAKI